MLATEQGLGYLAKSFYDHKVVDKVLIKIHTSRTNHPNWFPNGRILSHENYNWFFEDLDSIIYFEEPFEWNMLPKAREFGIKNILMPMYECTRFPFPYEPDLILAPSALDYEYYKNKNCTQVTVPVDVKWRQREKALIFVHNAGNGGLGGRNGTNELLEAMQYVKSPIKLIVRSQVPLKSIDDPRIEYRIGTFENIWEEGDVFVFPEKFNGLSLPLQEAYASGMLVMCGNRFPMNEWLPNDPLIPVKSYKKERISVEFESAIIDPKDIAQTIDKWYGKDISKFSKKGHVWGKQNHWRHLKKEYLELCA